MVRASGTIAYLRRVDSFKGPKGGKGSSPGKELVSRSWTHWRAVRLGCKLGSGRLLDLLYCKDEYRV